MMELVDWMTLYVAVKTFCLIGLCLFLAYFVRRLREEESRSKFWQNEFAVCNSALHESSKIESDNLLLRCWIVAILNGKLQTNTLLLPAEKFPDSGFTLSFESVEFNRNKYAKIIVTKDREYLNHADSD
jgi:hypothetical protein